MELNELLGVREKVKGKKPDFVRHDFHKKRLKKKWRKPRGIHSKIGKSGKPKGISTGYRSPKAVRGLHKSGLKKILVSSLKDLLKIKKETEGAIIASNIGFKKRMDILKKLKEIDVKALNIKNIDEYLKKIEDKLNARKGEKKKIQEKKEKKKEEKPKKEEKLAEKITAEEKKEEEKKEKDRILTKKG